MSKRKAKWKPLTTATCANCGRIVDTREEREGGDPFGCQLNSGAWACSPVCYEALAGSGKMEEVGTTSRGYTIFRKPNEVGGHTYFSDEIGGGVMVWDTALVDPETLRLCLSIEEQCRTKG